MTTTGTRAQSLPSTYVGARVGRKEDRRLLRGEGRFGHDVQRPRMLHARVVRSGIAHGRLVSIDATEAKQLPGVVDVVTGADLPRPLRIPVRLKVQDVDLTEYLQPILPTEEVRYVGEPIAVVLAEDAYVAEDAAELVVVDIDELPVVLDTTGPADDVTIAADFTMSYGRVADAFDAADHITSLTFDIGRHSAVPMEPRTLVADPVGPGELEIFGSTKVPVFNRRVLAEMLGLDDERIRMHAVDAGGGFGVRGEFYPEDFLIPWLALRNRRPVSWAEDRQEHLVSVNHSRQQRHRLSVALKKNGEILGLRADVIQDNGAYARTHGIIVPELTIAMLPGPYRVPAYHARARVALSHKTPCGTYRGPGRFEGTAAREQLLDKAAAELGIDRVELRRTNLLVPTELPHARELGTLGTDMVIDEGDFPGLFQAALDRATRLGWPDAVTAGRRDGRVMGLGVAMFMEKSGLGPYESADAEMTRTGRVRVYSGGTSLGQGIETALAQIAADVIPVGIDRIDVVNGDTAEQPFGTGSWASRSTVVAGNAVRAACQEVADRLIELAGRLLEAPPDELLLDDTGVRHKTDAGKRCSYSELSAAAGPASPHLRPDEQPGLRRRARFTVDHMTYPYGAHIALVEIDPGTGNVQVHGYLVVYEVGVAVNPTLIEGQLYGGMAQGIGGALLEEFRYDDAGQPQSATFMDYLLPTACEVPRLDVLVLADHPARTNPLGVRGAGEGGLTAAGGCLASAVRDALGSLPGVRPDITRLPITPAEILARIGSGTPATDRPG
ncbi:xanthine dehydrogenase family protein molybdopterin-binding subunit [Cumulibacter manganitolerans]|uniref:xanthine dehydrogenase family protein molybdopterin-binding subunit n=1 Tax=Cumulibacter manganitolerans TaxID=1884992 RepID=UPI001296C8AE|nr:xanthine dehydrogenase family protein molybdopterin-binding subunit [Cumulibacter manganitolerans]